MTWWYYEGADGWQFCYSKEPTFICPHSRSMWDCKDLSTGEVTVVERGPGQRMGGPDERMGITFTRHVSPAVARAAELLGMDGERLASMILRSHHSNYGRLRVDGKLTDRCKVCGARMERLGFYCFKQRPFTAEERRDASVSATVALNERLGNQAMKTVKWFYAKTKREAQDWAREEMRISKAKASRQGQKTQTGSDR